MAGQVADKAVQVHGGTGYMREVPVERIYRDVRLLRLYEGTSEIQRLIIGGGLVRARQRRLPASARSLRRRRPGANPLDQAGMLEGADDGVGAQELAGEAGHAQGG